jgi:acyl dehydratase
MPGPDRPPLTCPPVTTTTPRSPRDRGFEDFTVGDTFEVGAYEVDADEIMDFGRRYDPQPFHTDAEAAKASIFGGLIASGWHSCAMGMRMLVDNVLSPTYSLGSPGVDEVRFLAPVRPGARLRLRVTVDELVPSQSKPDRGLVRMRVAVLEGDTPVVSMLALGIWGRRTRAAS